MRLEQKIKLIAACIALIGVTQTQADSSPRISTGTVSGKVSDESVWLAAAEAYVEAVKQLRAKEGKQ
jgi:hypothetical protein